MATSDRPGALSDDELERLGREAERNRIYGGAEVGRRDSDTACDRCGYEHGPLSPVSSNGDAHWLCDECAGDVLAARRARRLGLVPSATRDNTSAHSVLRADR